MAALRQVFLHEGTWSSLPQVSHTHTPHPCIRPQARPLPLFTLPELPASSLLLSQPPPPTLPPNRPPAELSNSFIVASLQDLEPQNIQGQWLTPCEYAVRKAREIGNKHFALVPTAYWLGGPDSVSTFAFKDISNKYPEGYGFPTPTVELLSRWKVGLQVGWVRLKRGYICACVCMCGAAAAWALRGADCPVLHAATVTVTPYLFQHRAHTRTYSPFQTWVVLPLSHPPHLFQHAGIR
jgi:hypothetical protein